MTVFSIDLLLRNTLLSSLICWKSIEDGRSAFRLAVQVLTLPLVVLKRQLLALLAGNVAVHLNRQHRGIHLITRAKPV